MPYFTLADSPLKLNLHMHTTQSDGKLAPLAALERYEAAGYDAVAITDHRTLTLERGCRGEMLLLPGIEWDVRLEGRGEAIHLLGVGVDEGFSYARKAADDAQGFVDAAHQAGGLCYFCHPHWSLNHPETLMGLRHLDGVEVYNGVSIPPYNLDRADATFLLDLAAAEGCLLPTIAADDSHHYGQEIFTGFIYLNAQKSRDSILAALKAGNYHASQGPRILSARYEDGAVTVETSPVRHIAFHSNLPWAPSRCVSGENLTRAKYRVHPELGERFIRVVAIDHQGKKAWLNPVSI